jgi:hypothetical protein
VKRKVGKKLTLSKETLRTLDDLSLKEAAGGMFTDRTNACTNCTACASCTPTCMLNTDGVCCP